ncbi:MAG TPA: aldehyde dehydrogenase family protein [Longimicrobium sp.]|jgi:acyl-CoA reductase-like NAD-dependent aldehyde dehydrogenase|uniref:aldehyde dehydrogenase family protein n=1 Tax=Longimicrobium sp. TaxID=2029185 RepID=UPI002EDB4DB2
MSDTATLEIQPGRLFIGGEWQDAASGKTFDTINPATAETLTQLAEGGADDVDRAARAARTAFESDAWQKLDARKRGRLLYAIADGLEARADELARLETMDNGKPVKEARMIDIKESIDCFRYYAGWADKIEGDVIPVPGPYLNYTRREPVGVCGAIIPWNYPLPMAAWKVAPALACGNAMVLKPAEQTSLTALELARIAAEAGLPAGILNVVTGFGESAGAALVAHPEVDKIAFTGSTAVGKIIQRQAADTLKRVSLELGGKSPNIVLEDADVDAAVRGASMAIFYNTGQACTAGSRLLVHESIRDEFVEKLVKRAAGFVPGDPMDPKTRLGPLVSQEQLDRVLGYIEQGKAEGGNLLMGGDRVEVNGKRGYFVNPAIFGGVTSRMTIACEEIFGPVLAVQTFKDLDEALEIGNSTEYGLAAAVWTKDVRKAHVAAHKLRAGTVWINTYHNLDTASPFGGYKQSGYGRELGRHALDLYTQVKSVWVNLG